MSFPRLWIAGAVLLASTSFQAQAFAKRSGLSSIARPF